jgi:hypothetical protein
MVMPNNLLLISAAIFMATPFATVASARGRSFPTELTGTIQDFDRSTRTFILEADQPSKTLKIGLRDDCKFLESGRPAGAEVLRKGAHVKVSYFATIFTGNLAVEIEADPKTKSAHGVIKRIEPTNRRLTLWLDNSREFVVQWTTNAHFTNDGRVIRPETLTEGTIADVSYYSPVFGARYAVTVETAATPNRVKKNSR